MLRKVCIMNSYEILYKRNYGKALSENEFENIIPEIINEAFSNLGKEIGAYDYFKYKISYIVDKEHGLIFIFISGLNDDFNKLQVELIRLKKEFLSIFGDSLQENIDSSMFEVIDPIIDGIHRKLKPKISLVGFSGVGKTTITQLLKAGEIPIEHIPTINGDVATIKIGKLHFYLWDFAGQEQFSFLWNKFIKGSDAVLLITNSTLENLEKSKFFLELIKEETPYSHSVIIGNKQDLADTISVEEIERIMGVKTYSMVAIDPGNREKMIQIIADILEMSADISPLLKPLAERDNMINQAQTALENGNLEQAAFYFKKIADLCIEIGDYALGNVFYKKSEKLKQMSINL